MAALIPLSALAEVEILKGSPAWVLTLLAEKAEERRLARGSAYEVRRLH